jgi:peptidoglycan/LPS O-acetylase OafA/YrhL
MPYLPALDGLRTIAVVGVVLYHLDVSWVPGGFLGVDLFFVISGFLITALLLQQSAITGRISVGDFYRRRARRLLPALGATLIAVGAWSAVVATDVIDNFRREVLAAAFYVSNWFLIVHQDSYFETFGRPSPLRHLWSLAIEEQFYLIWPVLLIIGLVATRGHRRWLPVMVGGLALASFCWMVVLYEPLQDPSRIYFGTDTRVGGLLLGACLALVWRPWRRPITEAVRWLIALVGVVGLFGFALAMLRAGEFDPDLYRFGFLWVTLFGVAAVAAVADQESPLTLVLGTAPLVYLGLRSYAMYLVHWPIIVFTRPGQDVPLEGWSNFLLRVVLIVAATEVLHRMVEVPIRERGFRPPRPVFIPPPWWRRSAFVTGSAVLVVLALLVVVRPASNANAALGPQEVVAVDVVGAAGGAGAEEAGAEDPRVAPVDTTVTRAVTAGPTSPMPAIRVPPSTAVPPALPTTPTTVPTTTAAAAPTTVPPATAAPTTAAPTTAPPTTAAPHIPPSLYIGDSVTLGASPSLVASLGPQVGVDAVVSRQYSALPELVASYRDRNAIPGQVVIHLGTNGYVEPEVIDQTMAMLSAAQRVIFVNVRVPRQWQDSVNATLAATVPKYPNAVVVDWFGHSNGHPEWFVRDGVHLNREGIAAYVSLVGTAMLM